MNIIFTGATPINSYASKLHIRMLHSIIDREEHGKYLFLPLWKYGEFTHDSACPPLRSMNHSEKAKGHNYALFSVLSNILQSILSKKIA